MTEHGASTNGATENGESETTALASARFETASGVTVRWEMRHSGEDRRDASRRLLRQELQAQLGMQFELVQQCDACGSSEHGVLRVEMADSKKHPTPPLLISVSYADRLTVIAISPARSRALGIDVEYDTSDRRAAVQEALGSATEGTARSVREWTRLEAIAKARGRGLRGDWQHADPTGLTCEDLVLDTSPGSGPAILSIALV